MNLMPFMATVNLNKEAKNNNEKFSLVRFDSISTIMGHLMPNLVYKDMSDIYDLKTLVKMK